MRIVVVGGGSSATFFLENLVREGRTLSIRGQHSLTVIASAEPPGDLRAFGPELPPYLILNTPNTELDILIPGWRKFRSSYESLSTKHSARSLFGRFLLKRWEVASKEAAELFVFQTRRAVARKVSVTEGHYEVETDNGPFPADIVALCIGSVATNDSDSLAYCGQSIPFCSAYSADLERIKKGRVVGIAGSRLSAIDALLRLETQGHKGPIHIASPSGRLPRVRSTSATIKPILNLPRISCHELGQNLSLQQAWKLACKILAEPPSRLRNLLDCRPTTFSSWANEIRDAKSGINRAWQVKAYQASALMEDFWSNLSAAAQAQFLLKFRSAFLSNLVSIPLQSAQVVMKMLASNQLSVHNGIVAVENGRFRFRNSRPVKIDHLIDATGQLSKNKASAFVSSLAASGLAVVEPNGSIATNRLTCEVSGPLSSRRGPLVCVGDLSLGRNFVTSSLETNFRQAARASRTVLFSLTAMELKRMVLSR